MSAARGCETHLIRPTYLLLRQKSKSQEFMQKDIKNEGNVRVSREREELLPEGTRQDGVINFNLHCATPRVIYLRE